MIKSNKWSCKYRCHTMITALTSRITTLRNLSHNVEVLQWFSKMIFFIRLLFELFKKPQNIPLTTKMENFARSVFFLIYFFKFFFRENWKRRHIICFQPSLIHNESWYVICYWQLYLKEQIQCINRKLLSIKKKFAVYSILYIYFFNLESMYLRPINTVIKGHQYCKNLMNKICWNTKKDFYRHDHN